MNREQAQKAVNDVVADGANDLDWSDPAGTLREGAAALVDITDPEERKAALRILDILRQHRDYIRAEDEALAVWREVFVARCATVEAGYIGGATDLANDAEAVFRRRLAEHLKAVG